MTAPPASEAAAPRRLAWAPNAVTGLRLALAAPAAAAAWRATTAPEGEAFAAWSMVGFAVFAVAAGSDWLDGFLARRLNARSAFGAWLDPVADKALVWGVLAAYAIGLGWPFAVTAPLVAIVARDIAVTLVRLAPSAPARAAAEVGAAGKAKTVAQMLLVGAPLAAGALGANLFAGAWGTAWTAGLWAVAALTLATGAAYLRAAWSARAARSDAAAR